jgi:hypothetical protein
MDEIKDLTNSDITRLGLQLWEGLVEATPVDTGYAAAGWRLTKNRPSTALPSSRYPTNLKGLYSGAVNPSYPRNFKINTGDSLFLANNVKYIGLLNNGRSSQAPVMFIETTMARIMRTFRPKR